MTLQVSAQTTGADCAAIADDGQRLACYDALFRNGSPADAADAPVVIQSQTLIPAQPAGREPATMTFSCDAGELELRFGFAGNLLSATGSSTGITFTRDLSGDQVMTLPPSDNGTELIMSPTARVASFLDWLRGGTNVTVRVTPASNRSLSVRFRIAELQTELAPLLQSCR